MPKSTLEQAIVNLGWFHHQSRVTQTDALKSAGNSTQCLLGTRRTVTASPAIRQSPRILSHIIPAEAKSNSSLACVNTLKHLEGSKGLWAPLEGGRAGVKTLLVHYVSRASRCEDPTWALHTMQRREWATTANSIQQRSFPSKRIPKQKLLTNISNAARLLWTST